MKSCAPSSTVSATIRFSSSPSTNDRRRNWRSSYAFDRLCSSLQRVRLSFWCPSSTTNSPSSSFRKENWTRSSASRICTASLRRGVSREGCTIRTSSAEEVQLSRFSLRLNSTKMRRGAWQSKNIPRGDDSPWMSTYVMPLYAEDISNGCGRWDRVIQEISGGRCCCPPSDKMYRPSCASCHVKKVDLKFCCECNVFTCSFSCHQKVKYFLQSH